MIRFGTSGWRAVISDEFTFANVRRVTRAIASVLKEAPPGAARGVAVGCDTRFMAEAFAAEVARVLTAEGLPAHLAPEPLPTPVLAFAITQDRLAGGINVTASHNPPEWSGLKFSTADGAPAPPTLTARIESAIGRVSDAPVAAGGPAPIRLEPRAGYEARLAGLVRFDIIRSARLAVGFDGRFGTSRGWLDRLLEANGVRVIRVNDRRDPLFGGGTPDCAGANLDVLRAVVREQGLALGLATDGDGDRFGIVDADGGIVSPNLVLALLADFLAETRGWREGIGRTVATTHLLDRVAADRGVALHETAVGFKYFQELLADGRVFMGAEESAGFSVKGHVPEKDGLLAGLLVAEMVAARGRPLAAQASDLYGRVGRLLSRRLDRPFDPADRAALEERLTRTPELLAGVPVAREVRLDGTKWIRKDGAWLLLRLSGTEPVIRLYAEAEDEGTLVALLEAGAALVH